MEKRVAIVNSFFGMKDLDFEYEDEFEENLDEEKIDSE